MLESVREALRQEDGRAYFNVKLRSDAEEWRLRVVAADEIGLVVERNNGVRECYPWATIEAVMLPEAICDPGAPEQKTGSVATIGLSLIIAALIEAEAARNLPYLLGMTGLTI